MVKSSVKRGVIDEFASFQFAKIRDVVNPYENSAYFKTIFFLFYILFYTYLKTILSLFLLVNVSYFNTILSLF